MDDTTKDDMGMQILQLLPREQGMKRGTPRHPKVMALAAKLGVKRYSAVGLLEMLWHFTAEFALDGDIGKHEDVAIADALSWDGDSTMLVQSLVDAGWLDECGCHRLRVHDWHKHADQTVQRVLSKRNQAFLKCYDDPSTALAPSKMPLPLPLPKANTNTERDNARSNLKEEEGRREEARREILEWETGTCTSTRIVQVPDETIRMKPDPYAINVDPDNEATASMSGLTKELADAIHETWPDYPHFVTTAQALRIDAERIKGDWRPILGRVAKRFDPPYTHLNQDRLKKMLCNWFEAEAEGRYKASQAPQNGKGGVPHQSEPSRPSLTARLRRIDMAIEHETPLEPEWIDTWNEAVREHQTTLPRDQNIYDLINKLYKLGRIQLGDHHSILPFHSLPADPRTPKELLDGDDPPDPEFVNQQIAKLTAMKGLK